MARLKYQTKSNQSSIFQTRLIKEKNIDVVKIDIRKKTVIQFKIGNNIDHIRKELDFYNFRIVNFDKCKFAESTNGICFEDDCLIIGNDEKEFNPKNYFKIKGVDELYYGNAVLVNIAKYDYTRFADLDNLRNTKANIKLFNDLIVFSV